MPNVSTPYFVMLPSLAQTSWVLRLEKQTLKAVTYEGPILNKPA
jgi:hypothetical protein